MDGWEGKRMGERGRFGWGRDGVLGWGYSSLIKVVCVSLCLCVFVCVCICIILLLLLYYCCYYSLAWGWVVGVWVESLIIMDSNQHERGTVLGRCVDMILTCINRFFRHFQLLSCLEKRHQKHVPPQAIQASKQALNTARHGMGWNGQGLCFDTYLPR